MMAKQQPKYVGDSRPSFLYSKALREVDVAQSLAELVHSQVFHRATRCSTIDGEVVALLDHKSSGVPRVVFSGKVRKYGGHCVRVSKTITLHDVPDLTGQKCPSWGALAHECTHFITEHHNEDFKFWHAKVLKFLEGIYELAYGDAVEYQLYY